MKSRPTKGSVKFEILHDKDNNTFIVKDKEEDITRVCAVTPRSTSGGLDLFGFGLQGGGGDRPEMACGGPRTGRSEAEKAVIDAYERYLREQKK